ncbi:DUF317 domain-containing protein [Streptomyces sp. NPDC058603]|uniref:DUF317 domain-containing protein n=1 Tax=Streptomyces sp. NPDC058603 TaxID=3346551 RepID=UPI00364623F3
MSSTTSASCTRAPPQPSRGAAGAGERGAARRLRRQARLADPVRHRPRHLAGPGDARHVTHGLATAGWTRTSDLLSPEIVLTSPDHRLTLQLDSQSATSAWWRLEAEPTGAEPGWYAEFGERVPAEILGHLTDTLLIAPPSTQRPDPFQVLESAGWPLDSATAAHSADVMCHGEQRRDQDDARAYWHIETHEPGYGRPMGPGSGIPGSTATHPRTS